MIARYEIMRERELEGNMDIVEPKFKFNPKSTDFYEFNINDFSLEDYSPVKPQLKFELGI